VLLDDLCHSDVTIGSLSVLEPSITSNSTHLRLEKDHTWEQVLHKLPTKLPNQVTQGLDDKKQGMALHEFATNNNKTRAAGFELPSPIRNGLECTLSTLIGPICPSSEPKSTPRDVLLIGASSVHRSSNSALIVTQRNSPLRDHLAFKACSNDINSRTTEVIFAASY
jgi:hypothetical protein